MIIVIEGTDGSGKQTQSRLLYEYFVNQNEKAEELGKKKVLISKQSFPNYDSPSAGPVKMYLGGSFGNDPNVLDAYQASALFAVDRLCTMKQYSEMLKDDCSILILDRYVQSNMLHQAGKIKDINEVKKFLSWLNDFEFGTLKLPKANKVIFLDMPVEYSKKLANARTDLKNGEKKDIHELSEDHLRDAYNMGKFVAAALGWDIIHCVSQDGRLKSIDEVHAEIMNTCFGIKEVNAEDIK